MQDTDASSLVVIKRAINQGAKKFGAVLNREWRTTNKTFSTVASQQYYQMPEDAIRIKSVTVTIGGIAYPLQEIEDEDTWRTLNMETETSTIPVFYYVRGSDEYGIWPTPSASTADAGSLHYERRMRDMTEADYTTGTITLTNGSASVTGSGTTFTANMVGQSLHVNDPSGDGMWYKISGYTSATAITLENYYAGTTGAGLSYTIGQLPDIPEEYHESLIDYGCYRYYARRKDVTMSRIFKNDFTESVASCRASYGSKSASQYYKKPKIPNNFNYIARNLEITS